MSEMPPLPQNVCCKIAKIEELKAIVIYIQENYDTSYKDVDEFLGFIFNRIKQLGAIQ